MSMVGTPRPSFRTIAQSAPRSTSEARMPPWVKRRSRLTTHSSRQVALISMPSSWTAITFRPSHLWNGARVTSASTCSSVNCSLIGSTFSLLLFGVGDHVGQYDFVVLHLFLDVAELDQGIDGEIPHLRVEHAGRRPEFLLGEVGGGVFGFARRQVGQHL